MDDQKTVIAGAVKSAKGDRVLVNASLGFGQSFQCWETKDGTLQMGLCLTVSRDGLMILGDAVTKAMSAQLKERWMESVRENIRNQRREELVHALLGLRTSIVSGDPDSVFDSAAHMEQRRAAAASHGAVLDEVLSAECSFAMVDALDMLRER
jgi:hypothetical protein